MSTRPNILLITTDHWPAFLMGCAGQEAIRTPTLDELAREGTRFSNAYSECPVCIPARRTLMTGMSPRAHGDRVFQTTLPMPAAPTLPGCFRTAGYQTYAVGKLHVYPQRDRIGFDDVLLAEEGRPHWGVWDDYDTFLGDRGFAGRQFDHGMSNNEYTSRPWHLPEDCHVTNWSAREMSRTIRRRDPTRPGFWYLGFTHPHPPLVPAQTYWDLYGDAEFPAPAVGEWARDPAASPWRVQQQRRGWHVEGPTAYRDALRGFSALCTQIDHQLRLVIGTLREEGILDETAILFTADHGDMLGHHGLWAKRLFYENSANVPMLLVPPLSDKRLQAGSVNESLVGWQDIMPTLLDIAGIDCPSGVTGQSMLTGVPRESLYGECNEGAMATRMLRRDRFKLIYYPAGNRTQLFDLAADPRELCDLSDDPEYVETRDNLQVELAEHLYGNDAEWFRDGELVGLPIPDTPTLPARGLSLQRGVHWPPAPVQPPAENNTPLK